MPRASSRSCAASRARVRPVRAAQTGDPGIAAGQRALERLHLADVAAVLADLEAVVEGELAMSRPRCRATAAPSGRCIRRTDAEPLLERRNERERLLDAGVRCRARRFRSAHRASRSGASAPCPRRPGSTPALRARADLQQRPAAHAAFRRARRNPRARPWGAGAARGSVRRSSGWLLAAVDARNAGSSAS